MVAPFVHFLCLLLELQVVTDLDGNYILQVGSSGQGLNDGTFDSATFNRPQVRKLSKYIIKTGIISLLFEGLFANCYNYDFLFSCCIVKFGWN